MTAASARITSLTAKDSHALNCGSPGRQDLLRHPVPVEEHHDEHGDTAEAQHPVAETQPREVHAVREGYACAAA